MNVAELTIHEALALLDRGEASSVELTQAYLDRIEVVDTQVKAYLMVMAERALEQAAEADRRRTAGERAPLLGVPLAVKDLICTKGTRTTCGSRILETFVPPYDATVIRRLHDAGAVILGKLNMDEFAMGSSTENSAFFTTHNPWNLERVPGGSSGGSAAAVAAGECAGALGSDTGGSIRQPAGLCGVVGMKPTYGRVSRYGLVAFASSLDQIGPLTHDVEDAAILLEAIAGHDPKDSTSVDEPVPPFRALLQTQSNDLAGLRIGKPKEYFMSGMDPAVEQTILSALDRLQELGAQIVPVDMPHAKFALPVYYLIAPAEASANLARYDGVRFGLSLRKEGGDIWDMFRDSRGKGFGAEVKRRIMLGTYALSAGYYDAYYLQALKARTLIRQDFDRALEQCDLLAVPTTPAVAFPIGKHVDDPLQMYLTDIFTISLNLAGLPGISVPCGFVDGLPVGLQFQGRAFDEATILRAARAYEQATDWHTRRPDVGRGA